MSQFRTTADVLDEILQEAGEPTNGNSQWETLALTAANHVHHAFIGGGSIFNLNVDEPWMWARARQPITLELQAAVTAGTVSATADSTAITFTSAPAASVEGWHFQVNGKSTVYKIMNHTAGSTTAQLDSGFIVDSGTGYSYKLFKLDYEILPTYYYIDNSNDRLNFQETGASTYTASLTHGTYTATTLLSQVFAQMSAAGTGTVSFSGALNASTHLFNVSASVSFKMLGATGADYRRSVMPTLGFDVLDKTGAQVYTAAYTPNAIARLIEPFRHFRSVECPYIYSTDPIKMQEDFPLHMVAQKVPDRFCRLTENADGAIVVRFNSYPDEKMKIQMDWIPQPIDLQDNTASRVLVPRGDLRTFINAAAAYILYSKHDNKFDSSMKMVGMGLAAMRDKNRAALMRTGELFAQIEPRPDMGSSIRKLNYGYGSGGG